MSNPENSPSVKIYRPVTNIGPEQVGEVRTLAANYDINPDRIDAEWQLSLVSAGEIRAFYERHDAVCDSEGLKAYCEDLQPESAVRTFTTHTWPYHTYKHELSDVGRSRVRDLATVGQFHAVTKRETAKYKRLIEAYGDTYGPLAPAWIPVTYTGEVYIALQRRKANARNNIRRFMRALQESEILPQVLALGTVDISVDG